MTVSGILTIVLVKKKLIKFSLLDFTQSILFLRDFMWWFFLIRCDKVYPKQFIDMKKSFFQYKIYNNLRTSESRCCFIVKFLK